MNSSKWIVVGLSTAMAVSLVGCGSNSASSNSNGSGSGSNSKQELNISYSAEPQGLDPSNSDAEATFTFMNMTNEGLYRLDSTGKPQPAMAKDLPKLSADGKTYTITLKDNVKWSDGTPVTANDFVYSWKRTMAPDSKSQYAFMFVKWIKGAKEYNGGHDKTGDGVGVKALDDKTLQIQLVSPVSFFTSQLAFPLFFPENQKFVEKVGADKYGADADKIDFNGPFKLEKWDHEQDLVFVKNPDYWDAQSVHLNKITVNIVKDPATLENLYQTGQTDIGTINSDILQRWTGKPDVQKHVELTTWYLQFNERNKALQNAKIRQALTLAVDRSSFVNVIQPGSVPATGLVPTNTQDGNGQEFRKVAGDSEPAYDAAKAKQLLAEGMKEAGLTSFPKLTLIGDDTDTSKKTLEFVQGQLKQNLNIDLDVQELPNKLRIQKQKQHDYDITFAGWGADYNDPMTFLDMWVTGGEFNEVGYSNPQYDKLVQQAEVESDAAKRSQELVSAEKLLMQDMPVGPIYFRASNYLVRPNLKGMFFDQSGPEYELKWAQLN